MEDRGQSGREGLQVEVPVIDADVVQCVRSLTKRGWGAKRIASELQISRNTVRRYTQPFNAAPGAQQRPKSRRLDAAGEARACELWAGTAEGNAVVVKRLLVEEGYKPALRTVQRLLMPMRANKVLRDVATMRYETSPGKQMQIDFGQKRVKLGGAYVRVFFFVAVLGYSRRIFVRAGLSERQEDWQEGVAAAFAHFGGSTHRLLIDNPKAMVLHNKPTVLGRQVMLHPAFAAFCKDWGVSVQACAPYRARTKGKVESGVGYVKHNAVAGLIFTNLAALQAHLAAWMHSADRRIHGTTKMPPMKMFAQQEAAALMPLPQRPPSARLRRIKRKVANDCLVNVDTVRYSVPHRLVGEKVMVHVGDRDVRIFFGEDCVATHKRCEEPHQKVVQARHYNGLLRPVDAALQAEAAAAPQGVETGRPGDKKDAEIWCSLDTYQAVVLGASS